MQGAPFAWGSISEPLPPAGRRYTGDVQAGPEEAAPRQTSCHPGQPREKQRKTVTLTAN
jgi:hypothetical protein